MISATKHPCPESASRVRSIAGRGLTGMESVSFILSAVLLTPADPDADKGAFELQRVRCQASIQEYPRGVRYDSQGPQRKACRRFGADNRSLAEHSSRLVLFSRQGPEPLRRLARDWRSNAAHRDQPHHEGAGTSSVRRLFGSLPMRREWPFREVGLASHRNLSSFRVSGNTKTEFPTAVAVDQCHLAQDTETYLPKLDRLLRRSWGANTCLSNFSQ